MDDSLSLAGESAPPRSPLDRLEADLAAALVRSGILSEDQLAEVGAAAADQGDRLSTRLWLLGFATEEELRLAFAQCLKIPCANLETIRTSVSENADMLSEADVREFRIAPIARRKDAVLVATAEPWRLALLDDIGDKLRQPVVPCFLDEVPLARLLEAVYGIEAPERFRTTPELRTRRLVVDETEGAGEETAEQEDELMSETSFDRMYQS